MVLMVYIIAKRMAIIQLFFEKQQNANRIAQLFNDQHKNRHINR